MIFIARINKDTELHDRLINEELSEFSLDGNLFKLINGTYICVNVTNLVSLLENEDTVSVESFTTLPKDLIARI